MAERKLEKEGTLVLFLLKVSLVKPKLLFILTLGTNRTGEIIHIWKECESFRLDIGDSMRQQLSLAVTTLSQLKST